MFTHSKCATLVLTAGVILVPLQQSSRADDAARKVQETKNVTFIAAQTSADGSTEVRRELVKDCILSLPNPDEISPQMSSENLFVKEVNGEAGHDDWIRSYTAKLEINYLTIEKELLIITTRSVQSQAPVIKEVEKQLKHSEVFTSDPSQGDVYGGRSHRQNYFSKAESATKDVRERAKIWLQQQKPVLCKDQK